MVLKQDLRYIKTEAAFKDAFLELLNEMPQGKITVAKLCERAQCSRPAFYNHFLDMDDLHSKILDDFVEHLHDISRRHDVDTDEPGKDARASSADFFDTFVRNKDVILTLLKGNRACVQYQLTKKLKAVYVQGAREIGGRKTSDPLHERLAAYGAGGNISFMLDCLTAPDVDLEKARQLYINLQSPMSEFAVNMYLE